MSITATPSSIKVGEITTIVVSNLNNPTFLPNDSIINAEATENSTYTATVNPIITTIYYVSGYTSIQSLIQLNVTVYVNVTPENAILTTNYNTSIQLNVTGCSSYFWYPDTFLNKTSGSSVICTPLENIIYTICGTDQFSTTSRTFMQVIVNSGLIFIPENPTIYDGNLLNLNVKYGLDTNNNIQYTWRSDLFNDLKPYCVTYKYGNTIKLHPYQSVNYTVNAYKDGILITSGKIYVNVILKPPNIIDIDILPYKLANLILTRNTIELKKELIKDKILSKKIIDFYYTTLQTAYRMEWTNKNGIPFKINWTTIYQIVNDSNAMIINFDQQWNFFKYINSHQTKNGVTSSNFTFLLNNINEIYLEYAQKIYITPLLS